MNAVHTVGTSIMTSVITAVVALLPGGLVLGVEHLASVLILAAAAEAGRQIMARLWSRYGKKRS